MYLGVMMKLFTLFCMLLVSTTLSAQKLYFFGDFTAIKVESDARPHLKVTTEMTEGVASMADGTHQFGAERLNEIDDSCIWIHRGSDGYSTYKHTERFPEPALDSAVIHGAEDEVVFSAYN